MTLLLRELPELGDSVSDRLRAVVGESGDERVLSLLSRIPSSSGEFRLVATGEYSAGKSSLLKALTGAEIPIDSDVTTTHVQEYLWHRVMLVDTPGVKAGETAHDERAEEALRAADLVLFVITVDLLDDAIADHLRHVAFDLNKLDRMLIVGNKSATMSADPGVREAAVRDVLGDGWSGQLVECDAKSSLDAATAPDADRAAYLTERSNQANLEKALNELITTQANLGRLKRPFDAALAVFADVQPFLAPEPEELALAALVERRRQIMAESRLRLDRRLERALGQVRDQIVAAGDALVTATTAEDLPQAAIDEFEQQAQAYAESLGELAARAFETELLELTAEERGLVQGAEMQVLVDSELIDGDLEFALGSGLSTDPVANQPQSAFVRFLRDRAGDQGQAWLRDAIEQGSRPGSPLHNVVYKFGKLGGHKFKPWQAVKWAKRLGGVISAGFTLVEIRSQVRALQEEESELQRQQHAVRSQVREAADALVEAARKELAPVVVQFFSEASRSVVEIEQELAQLAGGRNRLSTRLDEIQHDARSALDTIAQVTGRAPSQ